AIPGAEALAAARSLDEARAIVSDVISALNAASTEARRDAVLAAESLAPHVERRRTMLSWTEIGEMARVGVQFGGHTRSHVPLDELPVATARDELFGSLGDLGAHLAIGQLPIVALPRGRLGPLCETDLRRAGVTAVMTSESGLNHPDERSLFVLRRDGRMLTLQGRFHPAKQRLELTGLVDRLRCALS
ncbi:polysaccharide deacetylase family protein, partial [Myxococcota bacterium]|nr:polysaccharide deacetylase family protein [Myxococcota bacterium]